MAATVGATLSTVAFPPRNAGLGPFISAAGTVYVPLRNTLNTGNVTMQRYGNPMAGTGSVQNSKTMSSSATTAIEAMSCYQNGNVIYVFTQLATGAVYFNAYTMDTDTWTLTTSAVTVAAAGFAPVTGTTFVSGVYRPTAGELVLAYNAGQTAMSSTFDMARYVRVNASTGAIIGTATNIDNGGSVDWRYPTAVIGASDRVHFFFHNTTTLRGYQRTLSAANALETFPANPVLAQSTTTVGLGHGVSFVDTGTTRVRATFSSTTAGVRSYIAKMDSADAPTVTTDQDITGGVAVANNNAGSQAVHIIANDGTDLHYLYSDNTATDLFYDSSAGGGGAWGTDTNELTGTVRELTANIYTRSGTKYLAMVLDDGGTIKYAEITLTAVAAAPVHRRLVSKAAVIRSSHY